MPRLIVKHSETAAGTWLTDWRTHAVIFMLVAFAIGGALTIRETTRFGSGLRDDSFVYMSAAEGIASFVGFGRWTGSGSFKPLTSFPPLYSFALAITEWIGLGVHAGARLLGGGGFALTILLSGFGILYATRAPGFALLASALVWTSPTLIELHSWALSETIFLPLSLASILALLAYIQTKRRGFLWVCGLTCGLAFLTRFAAASLVAALIIMLLFHEAQDRVTRLRTLGFFTFLSLTPVLIFLARNLALAGNIANRPALAWNPPRNEVIHFAGSTMVSWLIPSIGDTAGNPLTLAFSALLILGMGLVMSLSWLQIRRSSRERSDSWASHLVAIAATYGISYLALLSIWMSIADIIIQSSFSSVGERLLSPVHLLVLLLAALLLSMLWDGRGRFRRFLSAAIAFLFLGTQITAGLREVQTLRAEGRGYNSMAWRMSPTLEYIRGLPEVPIYTNDIPAVYLLTDRYATFIPSPQNPATGKLREDYEENLAKMRQVLQEDAGLLLILGTGPWGRLDPDHFAELTQGLALVAEFGDGLVFMDASLADSQT